MPGDRASQKAKRGMSVPEGRSEQGPDPDAPLGSSGVTLRATGRHWGCEHPSRQREAHSTSLPGPAVHWQRVSPRPSPRGSVLLTVLATACAWCPRLTGGWSHSEGWGS